MGPDRRRPARRDPAVRRWKSGAAVLLAALFSACSGGSCSVFGEKPEAPPKPRTKAPALAEPPVRLRDFLFPPQSCQVTLQRSDTKARTTLDYAVSVAADGRETISITRKPAGSTETYVIDRTGIHGSGVEYPAEAKRLELLTPKQRIVGVHDSLPSPAGKLTPCLTSLARRDKDKIFRTYRSWCRGVGLARIDETEGKNRVYTELVATTCRP